MKTFLGLLIAAVLLALGLWWLWVYAGVEWAARLHTSADLSRLGQAGDMFGGANALFAALAFAGVAIAAYYQYRTSELQRHSLTIASLEPLLFHLLDLHRANYQGLRIDLRSVGLSPYSGFDYPLQEVALIFRTIASQSGFPPVAAEQLTPANFDWLLKCFDLVYLRNEDQFGPYYRGLYHLFNLIDKSQLSVDEKVRYADVARSTLNKDELLVLMLNCALPRGQGFKRLIESYGLLKHISTDDANNALDQALARVLFHKNAIRSFEERNRHGAA